MRDHVPASRLTTYLTTVLLTSMLAGATAHAQTAAPETPPVPAAPGAATPKIAEPPPAAVPPEVVTAPAAVATEAKPPTAAEAMPATRPDVLPPIDIGAWIRAGSRFQGSDPSKVNDWHMDTAYVELHAGGKVTKHVGVTLNLNANMLGWNASGVPDQSSLVALEDAIISFDFIDEFHLWAGRLLVPVDRSNASGPFFMIPWNYPGFFSGSFVGAPVEGPSGRNNGAVIWGDIAGGKFSYFAGAFDNGDVTRSPLFSGKLRLALWDPEPGFWGNGSYFGDKDILSFDLGGQAEGTQGLPAGSKTYGDVNVDGLLEKKLGGGSFATVEAAYYHFNVADGNVSDSMYALLAYATPKVGVGSIQPMVRYQWENVKANTLSNPWNIDAAVSYLVKGPALRVIATYSHTKLLTLDATGAAANSSANSIQLGAQAIFF